MQIYNYDANGLYVGIGQADRSPLDEGEVYLITGSNYSPSSHRSTWTPSLF